MSATRESDLQTASPISGAGTGFHAPDDDASLYGHQRPLAGWQFKLFYALCVLFVSFHLFTLNFYPLETWTYRAIHVGGGLALGFAFYGAWRGAPSDRVPWYDWILAAAAIGCAVYIIMNVQAASFRFGVLPTQWDVIVSFVGIILVLEVTRRCTGWALPIISLVFVAYAFLGPYLPGFLAHRGYSVNRFFTYVYSQDGVFGAATAVSSTYIILFITFAAFLQVSKVGDYFINFAFSIAGRARGGPAKVAIFASGLMGMINGTSAGNVVSTGSLTIPLMKRVGYSKRMSGAIEAAASSGGQIMPPIMGAGVFIMAEITGIPYQELMIAGLIPAVLYFISIYFMVDAAALRMGLSGMPSSQLPRLRAMLRQLYLFVPIVILIWALFVGYSVIRAGTLAIVAALVISWLNPESRMGPKRTVQALHAGARMTIQLAAVCACAGIIIGVIALTGVGGRFSGLLLGLAQGSELAAMIFAMLIAILLGMGMPTTAAYAVAASVVAPGLIRMGVDPLVAHMFVFYYAVMSAITPPVALAAYAAAGLSGDKPMDTAVTAFKLGLAAYIVPFMFFYSPALLMVGDAGLIIRVCLTATLGVFLLASAVQGWFFGSANWPLRAILLGAALLLIAGSLPTDLTGVAIALAATGYQWVRRKRGVADTAEDRLQMAEEQDPSLSQERRPTA